MSGDTVAVSVNVSPASTHRDEHRVGGQQGELFESGYRVTVDALGLAERIDSLGAKCVGKPVNVLVGTLLLGAPGRDDRRLMNMHDPCSAGTERLHPRSDRRHGHRRAIRCADTSDQCRISRRQPSACGPTTSTGVPA